MSSDPEALVGRGCGPTRLVHILVWQRFESPQQRIARNAVDRYRYRTDAAHREKRLGQLHRRPARIYADPDAHAVLKAKDAARKCAERARKRG